MLLLLMLGRERWRGGWRCTFWSKGRETHDEEEKKKKKKKKKKHRKPRSTQFVMAWEAKAQESVPCKLKEDADIRSKDSIPQIMLFIPKDGDPDSCMSQSSNAERYSSIVNVIHDLIRGDFPTFCSSSGPDKRNKRGSRNRLRCCSKPNNSRAHWQYC